MLSATVSKRLDALGTISKLGKRINGLFRLLENPLLWYEAYANIYANKGAITPGVDGTTLDGFSAARVTSIMTQLKNGTYRFQPVRRTYVPKKNGKKRPLGIPSGDDKLVQEVVRIILERIYEPLFDENSHGFRPRRSPHTALEQIDQQWQAVKWMVDMDIRDYFNTINHTVLMGLLKKKIADARFLRLIQAMLDAGYLEDWTYHATYSGVPQGSIVSPILANVYLHELDNFMRSMKSQFDIGKKRKKSASYARCCGTIERLRRKGDSLKGKEGQEQAFQAIRQEIRRVDQQRKRLPCGDPFDSGYKRLYYCRYADDFVIGLIGSYADAERVQQEVRRFIQDHLKLSIAEEKAHICHSKKGVTFVGYDVRTYSGNRTVRLKRGTRHTTLKSVSEHIQLHVPRDKAQKFCAQKGYGTYDTGKAIHKPEWLHLSDPEILLAYNGELRGLANYYALALDVKMALHKLAWLWQQSLFKTLAGKHKTRVSKIAKRLKTDDGYVLTSQGAHQTRTMRVFRLKDLRQPLPTNSALDALPNIYVWTLSRSEVTRRLGRRQCEYCGTTERPVEVHHIRKLKDVARGKALWQHMMAARKRKTLVLCQECHHQLHAGTLPDRDDRRKHVKGEPCAPKGASTVLRGGDG